MLYFANVSGLTLEISIIPLFSSLIYLSRYTVGSFEYCLTYYLLVVFHLGVLV